MVGAILSARWPEPRTRRDVGGFSRGERCQLGRERPRPRVAGSGEMLGGARDERRERGASTEAELETSGGGQDEALQPIPRRPVGLDAPERFPDFVRLPEGAGIVE